MSHALTSSAEEHLRDERLDLGAEARTAMMVAHRELIRFTRARARVLTSLIQPLAFLVILGVGLNRLVGDGGEVNFIQFMLPGVIAMSVVTSAIFSGASVVWDREFGFLREMLVAPPRRVSLVLGKIAGGAVVATAQGALLLVLAPLIGITLSVPIIAGVFGVAVLTAIMLTALGVFLASRITRLESFQAVMQLLLMPMIFLSGAFFPLHGLPGWLTALTHLNPLTYAVDSLRQVVFSGQVIDAVTAERFPTGVEIFGYSMPVAGALAVVAGFAVLFTALSIRGFGKPD